MFSDFFLATQDLNWRKLNVLVNVNSKEVSFVKRVMFPVAKIENDVTIDNTL